MMGKKNVLDEEAARELERKLGHEFADRSLLCAALTHSSWANEAGKPGEHNERLEFLGDAALELCVSSGLFNSRPQEREGELTRIRANLVSARSLAQVAREIGLDKAVLLGRGEETQGGRERESILADCLEALLGAVFQDGGYEAAQRAVGRLFAPHWPDALSRRRKKDAKSSLQEATQRIFRDCPVYSLAGVSGPEHAKIFEVRLTLPDGREFHARNTSCKKAEQDAAAHALQALNEPLCDA